MALQLRPNCEYCDKDLPAASTDAHICSYECSSARIALARNSRMCARIAAVT